MINPNKMYRLKNAKVTLINPITERCEFKSKGTTFYGWIKNPKFTLGDRVNLQVQFSICLDSYIVHTANKPRNRKAA